MEERRKPLSWLCWTVVAWMLLVAYPLSIGPAMWLLPNNGSSQSQYVVQTAYYPILHSHRFLPAPLHGMAYAYLNFWNDNWELDLSVPL